MCHAYNEKWGRETSERTKLPNQEKNQSTWRKRKSQVVENIGSGHHQINRDERKSNKILPKNKKTKLYKRNLMKGIKTWAVPFVSNSGPFLKWTRKELK